MSDFLLLNIGNTHTQACLSFAGAIEELVTVPTRDLLSERDQPALLEGLAAQPVLAACVVPDVQERLEQLAPRGRLYFLSPVMVPDLDFSEVDSATLGADRLANAVAALQIAEPPLVVLDCGTAITMEVIDADRRFRGGFIAPGRIMQREALHHRTGLLPCVDLDSRLPDPIGTTTVDAIRAGIDLGTVGAVEKLLVSTCIELELTECTVLVTGGDAAYFADHIPGLTPCAPDFTLRGLATIAETL